MQFVLKDADGKFYCGVNEDSYGGERWQVTADVSEAVLFRVSVCDGRVIVKGDLPERGWRELVPVSIHVAEVE